MKPEDYVCFDGLGLAGLVQGKDVSRTELIEAAISIAERHEPVLNAIAHRAFEEAIDLAKSRDEAQGEASVFEGVPFFLKDIEGHKQGWPGRSGSRALRHSVASFTNELTARQLSTGAIALGKSTAPEFGSLPVTESELYGDTRNPWNADLTPGGSSGGSAALVAAGVAPFSHANDGGGSIRIPASCCGLVGLKPSRGRMPTAPSAEPVFGFGVEHIVARTVRDCAAMLDHTHGAGVGAPYCAPDPDRPYLKSALQPKKRRFRFAFWSKYLTDGEPTHPECVKAVNKTAKTLESMGHVCAETFPEFEHRPIALAYGAAMACVASAAVRHSKSFIQEELDNGDDLADFFEPTNLELLEISERVSSARLFDARETLLGLARIMGAFHETYDILITPVLGSPPIKIGDWDRSTVKLGDPDAPARKFLLMSNLANITGQPSVSLPLHRTEDGLPIGVMLTAAYGREDLLYEISGQLEQAMPWHDFHPPHWA